jgi:hypothetical protein
VASRSTLRRSPQAAAGRSPGNDRSSGRSRSSSSTGGRRVSECGLEFTSASQTRAAALASSSEPNPPNGIRSDFAKRTTASTLPFEGAS